MTILNPTLHELLEEPANRITFWATSTDIICPAESPYAYKGTARHLLHSQVWDLVGSHCPRCNDDWGHAKDGLRPCLTRGCYTWKQTGKHKTPPPISEEDIVFSEFEDDLHEDIADLIDNNGRANSWSHPSNLPSSFNTDRANENVDIPSTESKVISEPREPEFGQGSVTIFGQGNITNKPDIESDVTSQSTDTKNKEEKI